MKYDKCHGYLEEESSVLIEMVEGHVMDGGGHQILKPNKRALLIFQASRGQYRRNPSWKLVAGVV